ncbi:MAG: hypothetical protein R3F48_09205 [Candidatus Zixiibacteriota bacterium]
MKSIVIFILIFGFLATIAFAQSEYVEYGQNSVGGAVSFGTYNKTTSGYEFSLGMSSNGTTDINASYLYIKHRQSHAEVKSVTLSHLLLKEGRWGVPFSFGLGVGYTMTGLDNYPSALVALFKKIRINDGTYLQPSVIGAYLDPMGDEQKRLGQWEIGVSLFFSSPKQVYFIKPAVVVGKGDDFIGISVGFLYKTHHR